MAKPSARTVDRIDAAPRFGADDAARLNARFADADAAATLRAIVDDQLVGRSAIVSSFGADSAVLLHLVSRVAPDIPVLFLDTGKHFPETLTYRDHLSNLLGLTRLVILTPDPAALAARDATGLRWSYDPDGCCAIRKVAPMEAALAGYDAQFTGRKAFQAASRSGLQRFEFDGSRIKINLLADWDQARIDAYRERHDLPAHPLVAAGYPSIGCAPCTSMVQPGEDPRAGRWRGWDKTECGIHLSPVRADGSEDPVF